MSAYSELCPVPKFCPLSLWQHLCTKSLTVVYKQYVAVWEQRHGEWQCEPVCLLTGGGRHLGPALLPARWQGRPPAESVCVYAPPLKGQKLCRSCTSRTALPRMNLALWALCVSAVLGTSQSQVQGWRGLPGIPQRTVTILLSPLNLETLKSTKVHFPCKYLVHTLIKCVSLAKCDLCNWKPQLCSVFPLSFHFISTLALLERACVIQKDKLTLWNRSLPCLCGSPGYRLHQLSLPFPSGHHSSSALTSALPLPRPSHQHPYRDNERNRRQWGQRPPAWVSHVTNGGWID